MAINNIPGVGPSNADVANAVAAVVPDSADITAAVPTAAQIATAVAAPSAATIAAAVAAPSAATIASAVAAPSAATIASTVAASVPTLAQINTAVNTQTNNSSIGSAVAAAVPTTAGITSIVQANAGSPFGGTWTLLSAQNPGTTTVTFSGLSGYKRYRVCMMAYSNGGNYQMYVRINNLQGAQYAYSTRASRGGATTPFSNTGSGDSSLMDLTPSSVLQGFTCYGILDFDQASSGQYKTIEWKGSYYMSGVNQQSYVEGHAFVRETAAINRIDLVSTNGAGALTNTGFWLFGDN